MTRYKDIIIPVENANDETVQIIALPKSQGQYVDEGQVVCQIETSKSIVDVESPESGYFFSHYCVGDAVVPGRVLGYVGADTNYVPLKAERITTAVSIGNKYSNKALKLIEEHRLGLEPFGHLSKVKEVDVLNYLNKLHVGGIAEKHSFSKDDFCGEHLILWGAGLQAIVVLDLLRAMGCIDLVKCIVDQTPSTNDLYGIPVIQSSRIDEIIGLGAARFHICIGSAKAKLEVAKLLEQRAVEVITLIHPSAVISGSAALGKGVYIGPLVYVGPEVVIGSYSQINNCTSIAHHCKIGAYVMISDACHVGGTVTIGGNSTLGIGVIINRDINIGVNVSIPSGERVFNHLPDHTIVKFNKKVK